MPPNVTPTLDVQLFATGFNAALQRPAKVRRVGTDPRLPAPQVVSLGVRPASVKIKSYRFVAEPAAMAPPPSVPSTPSSAASADDMVPSDLSAPTESEGPESGATTANAEPRAIATRGQATSTTRIRPPNDTVRLEDRLFYLLQPPLETWLASESFEFAFPPFPYQMAGISFLYPRVAAILADEMGLGKTMQAISSIRLLLRTREVRSVLLICPKPLVSNWQREFALWAPEIPIAVIEGGQSQRKWQWDLETTPVKIANYELMVRDAALLQDTNRNFDLVVLDEAQRIKNRGSTTSQVARSISRRRSWALTGTPVENSAEDLVGIFEFLSPGFLNQEMSPRRMGQVAGDHILRRTKDQVLTDLPPKMISDRFLELTPAQREAYEMAEEQGIVRLTDLGEGATIQHVFELVLRLKQICNFDPATDDSAKLDHLEADLEEVAASGKKAIVFSQWVASLEKLAKRLRRFGPLEYHGKIPHRRRDGVLQQFRHDPNCSVILMSYGAGSVGLNLQFSEYVFLFDRWWNPAVEDQAINRAHRLGAAGPVTVTRFVSAHTIEERIHDVLEEKRQLFEVVLSQASAITGSGLTESEIFGLFNLHSPRKAA